MEDFRNLLMSFIKSKVFTEIKDKAGEYYQAQNCPNLTAKDGLALGATALIDYVFNTDEGRNWIFENHPLILALKESDIVFEYWGKDDVQPTEQIDPTKLRIVDKASLRRSAVKMNYIYTYTGSRPIPYMGLIPGKFVEYSEGTTSRCNHDKCENHTENRWCVKWSNELRAFRCDFCGHGAQICAEGRAECNGCGYSHKNLVPQDE